MKLNWRTLLAFLHDITACAFAWLAAFYLRFNLELPEPYDGVALTTLTWIVPLNAALFFAFGLYRGVWRFASLPDLRRIIFAIGVAALGAPALLAMLQIAIPRSVLIISPLLLILTMGGSRFAYRAWKEGHLSGIMRDERAPVFVIGTADAAVNLVKELARSTQWEVVGIFDDNKAMKGSELQGVRVLGKLDQLPSWKKKLSVTKAILAMPEATHTQRRLAIESCTRAGIQVQTVPSFDDLLSGKVTVMQIRNVELDDLLGRDPVKLDTAGLRGWISDHVVLVSGAGGSIGSELCRQIARFSPRLLILYELNELALYSIEQEFSGNFPNLRMVCAIGDVKDAARIAELMRRYQPSVVFHAAAYKHVPLMENENAWQAVLNNVHGTQVIARAATIHGVEKFVLISTDKAVNPTNVMGATKRLAEMVCQSLQESSATQFVMVRFGNVLGSTGSVIPKFREQIAKGGPVTVTHPEITRFFMSIPEAVQLVLQAGLMGKGGEILVLDMGEPVRIADLARELIRLSGYTEAEIRIAYTGLRPGEKLYEELLANDESTLPTPHPKLRVAQARREEGAWLTELSRWLDTNTETNDAAVKAALAQRVPEYTPQYPYGA